MTDDTFDLDEIADEDFPPLPDEPDDDGIRGCVFGGLWGLGVGLLVALALAWRLWAGGGW